jgi:transposase-like protein
MTDPNFSTILNLLDEQRCKEFLLRKFYPEGPVCPYCRQPLSNKKTKRFFENKISFCNLCRRKFRPARGTALDGTKLRFKEVILLMLLFQLGVPTSKIIRSFGRCKFTVNSWRNKWKYGILI